MATARKSSVKARSAGSLERAPDRAGKRTTLRVPADLLESAGRLAEELQTSPNDALIRLAFAGAAVVERAREIEATREARWRALVAADAGRGKAAAELPSLEEMREAAGALRRELAGK